MDIAVQRCSDEVKQTHLDKVSRALFAAPAYKKRKKQAEKAHNFSPSSSRFFA